ncbi:MAG TPA: hypothetical protein VIZ64_01725 [Dokdonella sp.]
MQSDTHRVASAAAAFAIALAVSPGVAAPAGAGFEIPQSVLAGGGIGDARGGCFALSGTVAQPLGGSASGGGYTIVSGFWAAPVARPDALLRTGFEDCTR